MRELFLARRELVMLKQQLWVTCDMGRKGLSWGDGVSLARVLLALLFVVFFRARPGALLAVSIVIALLAQLSDHLDGYLARRQGTPSVKGWLFDSVADRAFYISALLAFDREYGLGTVLVWLFVLREICLYAFRVALGHFEDRLPGFRRLALVHAGLTRLAIALGCVLPYLLPTETLQFGRLALTATFAASTVFGYYCLFALARSNR
jgi:phosphatidylglycerophosphate synthase